MNHKYLNIMKWLMYLYLIYTLFSIAIFIALGYFNYDNRFIGCKDGTCSARYEFVVDDEPDEVIVRVPGTDRAVKRTIDPNNLAPDIVKSMNESGPVKAISPMLNTLFIIYYVLLSFLLIFAIKTISKINKQGVFDDTIARSIENLVKGIIGIIIAKAIVSAAKYQFTLESFRIGLDSEMLFNIFVILLILFLADIIRKGAHLRTENDLTI